MEFSEVIRNRYSCKNFSGKEVEKEKLDQILKAGRLAPTAKNLQEQHIYVVQSEKGLGAIDKVTPCISRIVRSFRITITERCFDNRECRYALTIAL